MDKKLKHNKRSQLIVAGIIILALFGALIINTERVTADNSQALTQDANVVEAQSTEDVLKGYTSSALPSMFKLVGALIVVIGCIYLGLFLLRKMMGRKYSGNRSNNIMEVLETTYIGPKKTVSLIRVANKSVLVGSTETQISVLTELDSQTTEEILAGISTEEEQENFKNMFTVASMKLKELSFSKKEKAVLET